VSSAGGLPYVARDLMQFPMANPSDGCIDLVIQSSVSGYQLDFNRLNFPQASRSTMIKATVNSDKGEQYWLESVRPIFLVHLMS
jgi:sphingosine kinase